jgi:hypothetical protein
MALTKVTSGGMDGTFPDDSIVNADINSSAAVALSKLATDPSNASNLASGTVPTARLGSGTASSSVFLAGDNTWAEAGGGKLLQIQHSTDNTHISQGSDSEYSEITTAITPAATSSKIIVMVTLGFVSGSTTLDLGWVVKRDTTDLQLGQGGSGTYSNCTFGGSMNLATGVAVSSTGILVDSPSSTSEIEYKVFLMPNSNSMVINKRGSNTATVTSSTMTLMEIGA